MIHLDRGYYPYLEEVNEGVERQFPQLPAGRTGLVLDVGCGQGQLGEALQKKGYQVWGIEENQHAVGVAALRIHKVIGSDLHDFNTIRPKLNGAIFDFTQDNRRLSSLTVEYPVSTQPQVRLTIGGWTKIDAVSGAFVDYQEQRAAAREILASITPQVIEDASNQTTMVAIDDGVAGLPVDRVYIDTPAESFLRAVDVEASPNATDWRLVKQGAIQRWSGQTNVAIDIPRAANVSERLRIHRRVA